MDQRSGSATVPPSPDGQGQRLLQAFTSCPTLAERSPERDSLWLEVRAAICTRGFAEVTPYGSAAHVMVTDDHTSEELIAAMAWLYEHESVARRLDADRLLCTLRSIATRSAAGSARSAQKDSLHGMTSVPAGTGLLWQRADDSGAA